MTATGGTGAWEDYLTAAQRLDATRRLAATAAAEQAGVRQAATDELAAARRRLALQQARLADVTARRRVRPPVLTPTEAEAAAELAPGSGPVAVLAALHHARSTLDAADAGLTDVDRPGAAGRLAGRPPAVRNLPVYGGFALVALVLQAVLFAATSAESLPLVAPVCGLALPLLAFALGWLTVGLVYPPPGGGRVDRTPLVGAAACLVAPVLLTCAGFGVLALMR
jgi:hypothetical protein